MQNWHWPSHKSPSCKAAFGLRAIALSVHHFRFHCRFRCTPPCPVSAGTCMGIVCCILHIASLSYCAFAMLPVTRIVSRVQLCPLCVGGMGKEREGSKGREVSFWRQAQMETNWFYIVQLGLPQISFSLLALVCGLTGFICSIAEPHEAQSPLCLIILLRERKPTCTQTPIAS